jgi:uncharacterized delta-60 repeat protein
MIGHPIEPLEPRTLLAAGQLDPDFGDGGVRVLPPPLAAFQSLEDVLVQPDGKPIIGGQIWRNAYELRRYQADFRIDTGFGRKGIVNPATAGNRSSTLDLALQADGKILRLHSGSDGDGSGATHLERLASDGRPDPSFGDGGEVTLRHGPILTARFRPEHLLADLLGGIVVVGHDLAGRVLLRRLRDDGRRDWDFGDDGQLILRLPQRFRPTVATVHRLPDGKYLLVGAGEKDVRTRWGYVVAKSVIVARFHPDGSPDRAYGDHGVTRQTIRADGRRRASLGDHLLLDDGSVIVSAVAFGRHVFAMRFNAAGRFDDRFGNEGRALLYRSRGVQPSMSVSLASTREGRIAFTTSTLVRRDGFDYEEDVLVGRLRPNGSPDRAFGTNGTTITDIARYDRPIAIVPLPDGGLLVIVEAAESTPDSSAVVLRYDG